MIALGLLLSIAAASGPPKAVVVMAPDGKYSLAIETEMAWQSAEIAILGDRSRDVGPAQSNDVVSFDGAARRPGKIWVTVNAAINASHGVSWVFCVEPEMISSSSRNIGRIARRRIQWKWLMGSRR